MVGGPQARHQALVHSALQHTVSHEMYLCHHTMAWKWTHMMWNLKASLVWRFSGSPTFANNINQAVSTDSEDILYNLHINVPAEWIISVVSIPVPKPNKRSKWFWKTFHAVFLVWMLCCFESEHGIASKHFRTRWKCIKHYTYRNPFWLFWRTCQ